MIENGLVVRRKGFKTQSIIGRPETTIKYLQNWNIDELIIINVGGPSDITKVLDSALKKCFVPVTIGGSIKTFEEVRHYIRNGADKVIIGKYKSIEVIEKIADFYGSQALSISIDYNHKEEYERIKNWPIGDVVFHDKSRDGMGKGLNIDILKIETNHPKIAMGGVGKYEDIVEGLRCSDGVAVGNLFSFKEISARQARTEARRRGLLVR